VGELKRTCYACKNGLVGAIKDYDNRNPFIQGDFEDEFWECQCTYYTCFCEENNENFFCPVCNDYFKGSNHLLEVFGGNKKSLWIANMVTHHRHHHITSWNKRWDGTYQDSDFNKNFIYDFEKMKLNEQAKRQIITKCKDFIVYHKITVDDLLLLKDNEPKTIEKWVKLLSK
jgi:hypothetical protein